MMASKTKQKREREERKGKKERRKTDLLFQHIQSITGECLEALAEHCINTLYKLDFAVRTRRGEDEEKKAS